jgi:hypothetical protein
LIGSFITEAIIQRKSSFERIAIFTSPATAESKADKINALKNEGVEIIIGDVANADNVAKAYKGTELDMAKTATNHE